MNRHQMITVFPFAFWAALAFSGCNSTTPPSSPASGHEHHEADGHEHHEGDGHEHHEGDGHDHGKTGASHSEGPHHGNLIELGQEEYHAELTHDHATNAVTVYLLDREAKVAQAIADTEIVLNLVADGKPTQVKLAGAPQEGDPSGQSSRFTIVDEKVLELFEAPNTTGRLNISINGKAYTGVIESLH